uniref:Ovule protein n=1 Tax=Gongylonema pulchrum TaxID=637853 RepID=A0A183CWS6_9BILA
LSEMWQHLHRRIKCLDICCVNSVVLRVGKNCGLCMQISHCFSSDHIRNKNQSPYYRSSVTIYRCRSSVIESSLKMFSRYLIKRIITSSEPTAYMPSQSKHMYYWLFAFICNIYFRVTGACPP